MKKPEYHSILHPKTSFLFHQMSVVSFHVEKLELYYSLKDEVQIQLVALPQLIRCSLNSPQFIQVYDSSERQESNLN